MKTVRIRRTSTRLDDVLPPCEGSYLGPPPYSSARVRDCWHIDIESYDALLDVLNEDIVIYSNGDVAIYDDYLE